LAAAVWLDPSIPADDQVVCPPAHHGHLPIPAQWFTPEVPYQALEPVKFTPTAATDGIGVTLAGARWFQGYVGGASNGVYALYDTGENVYYLCSYEDTARVFDAWAVPLSWVPRAVPAVAGAALHLRTTRGIVFGDSPAQIEAIYGKAPLQFNYRVNYLAYEKDRAVRGNEFATQTTFFFSDGKLIGIERLSGF
ncbi:MAG TPA: hypothetical protein VMG98_05025, partial [Verrucomicrobiae bacterium]|nr:hypothetical protein [Verrucomicrobiae bacterium]